MTVRSIRTPRRRCRAAARSVSAGVASRRPSTTVTGQRPGVAADQQIGSYGNGRILSSRDEDRLRHLFGSHQPNCLAAVRWVNAALAGRSRLQAARSRLLVRVAVGTYKPRDKRVQPASRCLPNTGVVTSEVCARRLSCAAAAGRLWITLRFLHRATATVGLGPLRRPKPCPNPTLGRRSPLNLMINAAIWRISCGRAAGKSP